MSPKLSYFTIYIWDIFQDFIRVRDGFLGGMWVCIGRFILYLLPPMYFFLAEMYNYITDGFMEQLPVSLFSEGC